MYRSCTDVGIYTQFLVRFFLFFGTIVNCAVFRISTSYCSLLVQRNIVEFYILILYLATLLNSLIIHSGNLLVDFLVFSK